MAQFVHISFLALLCMVERKATLAKIQSRTSACTRQGCSSEEGAKTSSFDQQNLYLFLIGAIARLPHHQKVDLLIGEVVGIK